MFETLRHLLPDSVAWRVVVDRLLRKYLTGLSSSGSDAVSFVDSVYEDMFPQTTRQLEEWEALFRLDAWGTEQNRRDQLEAWWGDVRGGSPKRLQDALHTAGFTDAIVLDWFTRDDVRTMNPFGASTTDITPDLTGICFGAGGRYLFVSDSEADAVRRYSLLEDGEPAQWDLSAVVDDSNTLDVSGEELSVTDVQVSHDGTRLYIIGTASGQLHEYEMSVPFDLSTASLRNSFSGVAAHESIPLGMAWHPDGTRVYITGTGSNAVQQFALSAGWDMDINPVHTGSYNPGAGSITGVAFTSDGEHMLVVSLTDQRVHQFDLGTPWAVSTATDPSRSKLLSSEDATPLNIYIDGAFLFMVGAATSSIHRYAVFGPRPPLLWANQPLLGTTQCGDVLPLDDDAACGEPDSFCNEWLANETWYLWNEDLTLNGPQAIPEDPTTWAHFWYVTGGTADTPAALDIPAADRDRFERLLYRLGPAHAWVVTYINIT